MGALEVLRTKALKWRWRTDVARCVLTPRCTGAPLPAGCHLCRGFAPSQSRHPPESQARIHLPLLPTHLATTLTPSRRKRVRRGDSASRPSRRKRAAPVEAKARRARRGESAPHPSRRKGVAPVEAKARRARRDERASRPSRHDLARSYAILRDKSRSCKNSARPGVSCSCMGKWHLVPA